MDVNWEQHFEIWPLLSNLKTLEFRSCVLEEGSEFRFWMARAHFEQALESYLDKLLLRSKDILTFDSVQFLLWALSDVYITQNVWARPFLKLSKHGGGPIFPNLKTLTCTKLEYNVWQMVKINCVVSRYSTQILTMSLLLLLVLLKLFFGSTESRAHQMSGS